MRLFVQVLFDFIDCFCYRAVTPLFFQAFQACQQSVSGKTLFLVYFPDIFIMRFL